MPDELIPIHGCEDAQRVGDVVFVHGLNGEARRYWCYEGLSENYWPAWVGEDIPNVGVWSLGYENAAFRSRKFSLISRSGFRGFAMPLSDRAKAVLLQLEVAGLGERPLVFVTHSMGGLLIKQMLRTLNENTANKQWKALIQNTRGICFIATPHIGSDLAKWASYFRLLLDPNVSTKELTPHGPLLRELNEFYRNFVTTPGVNIETISFYETKPLIGNTLVVAAGDADPGVPHAGLYALGEDHNSICKPHSKSSVLHIKLLDFIRQDCFHLAGLTITRLIDQSSGFFASSSIPAPVMQLIQAGTKVVEVQPDPDQNFGRPRIAGFASLETSHPNHFFHYILKMRHSPAQFIIRVHHHTVIEYAAEYIAHETLPHLRGQDYHWELVYDGNPIPEDYTFEVAGIKNGEVLYLLGNHRRPSWSPSAR